VSVHQHMFTSTNQLQQIVEYSFFWVSTSKTQTVVAQNLQIYKHIMVANISGSTVFTFYWRFDLYQKPSSEDGGTSSSGSWQTVTCHVEKAVVWMVVFY